VTLGDDPQLLEAGVVRLDHPSLGPDPSLGLDPVLETGGPKNKGQAEKAEQGAEEEVLAGRSFKPGHLSSPSNAGGAEKPPHPGEPARLRR